MANALLTFLGLLGGLLLQSQGISLHRSAGDSSPDRLGASDDPSLVGSDCRDPAVDDRCFKAVKWALEKGVHDHPEWYPAFRGAGLTEENFREMQLVLHNDGKAGCGKPCPLSDLAEMEAEINKKEAEMMAQEAQARVNRMEEEAKMGAQVARQHAKMEARMEDEEAVMEEARMDMMKEKAEAQKASHEDA